MTTCLCCEEPLEGDGRYHDKCLERLFGRRRVPSIPFRLEDVPAQVVNTGGRMSISGVQMKLSVRVNPTDWEIETVATGGTHILKPEPNQFPEFPANENLCMNIADDLKLLVPPHGLFPMADGKLCYIIKRFDRLDDGTRLQNETMYQILESAEKYDASLERVGKAVRAHVDNIGLDLIDFFERVVLCFLIGNGDMHLKNWAILTLESGARVLAPCYDFVSSRLYIPKEDESALTINGKKNRLQRRDFETLAATLGVDGKAAQNSMRRIMGMGSRMRGRFSRSRLSPDLQRRLTAIVEERFSRLDAGRY
jgi:serine/threonine-protein kinase HipA